MQKFFTVSCLCLGLSLTGCLESPQPSVPPPMAEQTTQPVATMPQTAEPTTPTAKAVTTLLNEIGGKWTLTAEGTVKSITADGSKMSGEAVKMFGEQPDMETLQILNYRELRDGMIDDLKGLTNLRNLSIVNAGITDKAVKTIAEAFPNLRSLDLSSNENLTGEALKSIATLKDLEVLTIIYCAFGDFGMIDVASLPRLRALDIRANMVGNTGLGFLAKIQSLRSLKHRSSSVDDYGMEALTQAMNLESLLMQDFEITDATGELLKKFEKLRELEVFRCKGFGPQGVLELKGMPLTRLTLRDLESMDDSGMEVFRELPTLRRLYLIELPSVSDAGLASLAFLKELEVLDIGEVPMTDESLKVISPLPNLRDLSIRSTDITDAGVDALLSMPKLERLALRDNAGLSNTGRQRLREKGYTRLDFGATTVSNE